MSKDVLFSVSLPPFSCPSCLEYLRPRALILLRPGAILTYYLLLVDDRLLKREALNVPLCISIEPVLEAVYCCSLDDGLWQFVPMRDDSLAEKVSSHFQ